MTRYPSQLAVLSGVLLLTSFTLTSRADYSSTVVAQQPVGYWRLNESVSPPVLPIFAANLGSLGTAANGTYSNAVRGFTPGALASEPASAAVAFQGISLSGNRVRIPFQPQWNASTALTVEFWAKPGQTNTLGCPAASVEFIPSPAQRNGWLFYQGNPNDLSGDGNGWMFRYYNNGALTNLTSAGVRLNLDTNQWYHIVGVVNGLSMSIYVNGVLGTTTNFVDTLRANTNADIPLTFGARADGVSGFYEYTGKMDEAAIYDAALSPARILAHYQAGTNPVPATAYSQTILADAPAGYWRFNEPADPPAANLGTLGSAGAGTYVYNAAPGVAGPRSPAYSGFEAVNNAVSFDGVGGGYVSVPGLYLNNNNVTITAWIKASSTAAPDAGTGIIMNRSGDTIAGLTTDIGGGLGLSYNWAGDTSGINWASGILLADGDWTYVALVIQPEQAALYAAYATDSTTWNTSTNFATHPPQPFEGPTLFGADYGPATNLFFKGTIDEVAIYNRALSEGELYTAYGSAVGGVGPQIFTDVAAPPNSSYVGDPLQLLVDAGGTPNLAYQWRKNGAPVAGATSNVFVIASLKSTDAGNYDVIVTNAFGKVTSSAAAISILIPTPPAITQGPTGRTLYEGGTLDLRVAASGGGLQYQWQKDNTNLPGAITSEYVVSSVSGADAGAYSVSVTNSLGSVTAGPVNVKVIIPVPNSFEATIVADGPEAWWRMDDAVGSTVMADAMGRHDGTYIGAGVVLGAAGVLGNGPTNAAASFDGSTGYGDVPYSSDLNSSEFTIEAWAFLTDGTQPRAVVSTYDTSGFKGMFFMAIPSGVNLGGIPDASWNGGISVGPSTAFEYVPMGDLSVGKWAYLVATFSVNDGQINYYNGQQFSGPFVDFKRNGKADFQIGSVGNNFQGIAKWKGTIDEVAVYKHALTPQQVQAHYIQALYGANSKPVFLTQPKSVTLALGDSAQFSAQVEGSIPLALQWTKNGVAIPNATNSTISFGQTAYADTGNYQLIATNAAGTNASAVATLTVLPPVTFANATNALVLHLKFDGNYADASGRGNNGTAMGAPAFVTSPIGQALHYSTTTDNGGSGGTVTNANYVSLGHPSDLQFGSNNSFSVAFWVRLPKGYVGGDLPFFGSAVNSANNQGFTFCPSYGLGGWQWDLMEIAGAVTNNIDVNGADDSINDGDWHHFAATFDRSAAVALTFLDGAQVDSTSIAAVGTFDSPNSITVGQDPTGLYAESGAADLDDLGVWRRALSPLEVYEIYYSGVHSGAALDAYGPVSLGVTTSGGNTLFLWQAGALLQADTLAGPWVKVTGADPPTYSLTPGAGAKFYRVAL